jgi:hypothetical protein
MDRKLIISGLFFSIVSFYCFTQDKLAIYPSRGVGTIQLQSLQENVNRSIGFMKPSEISKVIPNPSSPSFQMWLNYSDLGLTLVYDGQSRRLKSIVVMNQLYTVLGTGLKVGDRRTKIPTAWGRPESGMQNAELIKLTYSRLGIEFWIDSDDLIFAIVVVPAR